jgi:hypothetical protein
MIGMTDEVVVVDYSTDDPGRQFPPQIVARLNQTFERHNWARSFAEARQAGQRTVGPHSAVGRGWIPLIVELDARLSELDPNYRIEQIKEKFGLLRYYATPSTGSGRAYDQTLGQSLIVNEEAAALNDNLHALIHEAENQSGTICEICGEPGKLIGEHWLKVRCEEHIGV